MNISSNLCVCEQPIRRQNLCVRWLLNGVIETICSVLKILWREIRLLSSHVAKNLLRAVKRSLMRIIVLPVGRCRFLEENESGLRFRRNKISRFTECTTPYNRPSIIAKTSLSKSSFFAEMVSLHTETPDRRVQFEERFRKALSSWRIGVDGGPTRRNKAAFSNFSGVVEMESKLNVVNYYTVSLTN